MSRYGLWGIAAAAAMMAAPLARADDRSGQQGTSSTSNATSPGATSTGASDTSSTSRDPASSSATSPSSTSSTSTAPSSQGSDTRTSSDQPSKSADKSKTSSHDNTNVIPNLYAQNVFEIESAKIAEKNAQSKQVKDFAKQIQKDHGDVKDALAKLAKDRNLKLDEDQAKKQHQAHLDQMKAMKGVEMDRHFAQMMVSGHEKDLDEVKMALSQARQSGDNELTNVLETAQSKIQEHHKLAQSLEGGSARQGRRGSSDRTSPSSSSSDTSSSSSSTSPSSTSGSTSPSSTSGSTSPSSTSGTSSSSSSDTSGKSTGSTSGSTTGSDTSSSGSTQSK